MINNAMQLERETFHRVNKDIYRLKQHIMPPIGWINDPNGLCYFKGEYHVFFQYSPFEAKGGDKFWGHYKGRDLMHLEYAGISFAPEDAVDKDGVYSGCAFVEDEVMHIFYTGNVKEDGDYDFVLEGRYANIVHVTSKDGMTFSEKKCVLTNTDYPDYYSCHIRDPKVWKENGKYYMVLGGRDREDKGRVLVYESQDLDTWTFTCDQTTACDFGFMWECPDVFNIDGKEILSISPQGLPSEEYVYQNGDQSGYFVVDGSVTTTCYLNNFREWDMGFDFYAPQSFQDNKGRRILIGWMGLPAMDYTNPTIDMGWQHNLTLPREISIQGNKVCQQPIEEVKALRDKKLTALDIAETKELFTYEIDIRDIDNKELDVVISEGLHIMYNPKTKIFQLKFTSDIGCGREVRKAKLEELQTMDIYVDTSVVEIYINKGEMVFATRFYPKANKVEGIENIEVYDIWSLEPMEVKYNIQKP